MTFEEADYANFNNALESFEFLISKSSENEPLNHIGFYNKNDRYSRTDETETHQIYYRLKTKPSIIAYNKAISMSLFSFESFNIGLLTSTNLIRYNCYENNWMIRIETNNTKFTIIDSTEKIELDITSEADLFQFTLLCPSFPEYLFDFARKSMHLISTSDDINKVLLKSERCIIDLGIANLREEYNRVYKE